MIELINVKKDTRITKRKVNKSFNLSDLLPQSNIFVLHNINHKKQLFAEVAFISEKYTNYSKNKILKLLLSKENRENSGIGGGVALPNIKIPSIDKSLGIFLKLNKPITYNAIDNEPIDLIFVLLTSSKNLTTHLNELAYISRLFSKKKTLQNIRASLDNETIHAVITND